MDEDLFFLSVKGIIRNEQGDILILKAHTDKGEHKEYWDLPGGRLQKKDTPGHALQREVKEETGIDIASYTPLLMMPGNTRFHVEHGSYGIIFWVYQCEAKDVATITLSEHSAYEWVSPWKAAELLSVKYPEEFTQMVKNL